jgi:hypothetical protein
MPYATPYHTILPIRDLQYPGHFEAMVYFEIQLRRDVV